MAKIINFKDLLTVDYAPGMDPLIKRNAKKRKGNETETSGPSEAVAPGIKAPKPLSGKAAQAYLDGGKHAANITMGREGKHTIVKNPGSKKHIHVFTYEEYEQLIDQLLDEAVLNPQQRRLKAMQFKRMHAKIELGQKRAQNRFADPKRLLNRAKVAARKTIFKKLTKGMSKDELSYQRRQEIEKRLDTPMMKRKIQLLATKMIPKQRQAEIQRHQQKASPDK